MRSGIPILLGLAGLSLAGCGHGPTAKRSTEASQLAGNYNRENFNRYVTMRTESLMRSGAIPDRLEAQEKATAEAVRRYGEPTGTSAGSTWGAYKKKLAQSELNASLTKIERDRRQP